TRTNMSSALQGRADPLLRPIKSLVEQEPSRAARTGDEDHPGAQPETEPHAPMMPAALGLSATYCLRQIRSFAWGLPCATRSVDVSRRRLIRSEAPGIDDPRPRSAT